MSLKNNIIANYASQLYVTVVGIVILPLYIKYMGAEAYGLVAFFTMLQAWFALLDMGLTPTIGRETARYNGGAITALAYRQLFRAISLIFLGVAILGGSAILLFSDIIANHWLKSTVLPKAEVIFAVQIMAVSIALRWMGGLFRGVVTGFERLTWISGFSTIIATLRFIAVFLTMAIYGFTPIVFFVHQFMVVLVEVIGLFFMTRRLLPDCVDFDEPIGWSFHPVRELLKFSLTIAFTSSVWIIVTQTDKLVLSGILPLSDYGYFTLAVLAASGVMVISAPISNAIMPRMARFYAMGMHEELIQLYRSSTQLICVMAGSAAITIAFCATPLLVLWTGNPDVANNAAPVLRLYAIGNGILAVSALPYYLQYARGSLRYHFIGNAIMGIGLIPAIAIAANLHGGVGAGYTWMIANFLFLLIWVAYVHSKLEPGLHFKWLINDCLAICAPIAMGLIPFLWWPIDYGSRGSLLFYILSVSAVSLLVAVVSSRTLRVSVFGKFKRAL